MPHLPIRQIRALIATFSVLAVVAAPQLSHAATDTQHIVATPSSAELSIAPGKSISASLEIINQGSDSFGVKTSVAPYHVEGIEYDPQFTQLPGTVDASKWVRLEPLAATTLAPGKLVHVNYEVRVPVNTPPGGYYAVIFAQTMPTANGGGVVAHNRVGEILYLTVAGKVHRQGEVVAGHVNRINLSGDLNVPTLVRNTGGVHFKTKVTVSIKNLFGSTVFKQHNERYVLPQTERQITIEWKNLAPLGIYQVSRQATTPGGTKQLSAQWVIMLQPWLLAVVGIAGALVLSALLRRTQGWRRQK